MRGAGEVGETWGSVSGLEAQMHAAVSQRTSAESPLSPPGRADPAGLRDRGLGRGMGEISLGPPVRLDVHLVVPSSRWTAEERAWPFDGIGRLPAVGARARRRAVANSRIFSGHG